MTKILILGRNGQVGSALLNYPWPEEFEVEALDRSKADFLAPQSVYDAVKTARPDLLINAVAYTAVDQAESEPEKAQLINASSVEKLVEACRELDIPLIHLSTDYVFDGQSVNPYKESASVAPLNVYGRSKLQGEIAVQKYKKHVIFRTSWVFGVQGNNFVKTMLRLAATRDELGIVSDQRGRPTYAGHIAEVVARVVAKLQIAKLQQGEPVPWGVYHLADQPDCSWYEFAIEIFDRAFQAGFIENKPRVNPITSDEFPVAATRPTYSVLDTTKLETLLGQPMYNWRDGLDSYMQAVSAEPG